VIAGLYIPQGAIRQSGAGVKTTGQHGASNIPLAYDPRVLRLLSFLTRTQAWLTPPEIAKTFRIDGRPIGVATLYRWFAALEDATGLAYFPYPRMNVLGLQEVAVHMVDPERQRERHTTNPGYDLDHGATVAATHPSRVL